MKKSVFSSWMLFFAIFFTGVTAYADEGDFEIRVGDLEESERYQTLGAGIGVVAPSDYRLETRGSLEVNLRNFFGCYYTGAGLCLGMSALEEFWRFKVRWAGVGVFLWGGEKLSISEINRGWDIMATSGVDIRLWRGMELRAQLQWFFPNPGAVFRFAGSQARDKADKGASARGVGRTAWHTLSDTYAGALMTPSVYLGARWEF